MKCHVDEEDAKSIIDILLEDEDTRLALKVRNGEENLRKIIDMRKQMNNNQNHEEEK